MSHAPQDPSPPDPQSRALFANALLVVTIPDDPEVTLIYDTVDDGIYTVEIFRAEQDLPFMPGGADVPIFAAKARKTPGATPTSPAPTIVRFAIRTDVTFDDGIVNPMYFKSHRLTHSTIPTTDHTILHRLLVVGATTAPGGGFTSIPFGSVSQSQADINGDVQPYDLVLERPAGTTDFVTQWKRVTIAAGTTVEYVMRIDVGP